MIYAGFWDRFLALLIDCVILWVISMILIIPYFIPLLGIIIAGIYHVVFLTSPLRATPGKAIMKLAVVKTNGSGLTVKDAIIRYAVSFLSTCLLFAGYFMALFTGKKQTLHDMIADTVVVEETFATNDFWKIFVSQAKVVFKTDSHPLSEEKTINSKSLEELYDLYQKGILTEEEYKMKKEEYLKKL